MSVRFFYTRKVLCMFLTKKRLHAVKITFFYHLTLRTKKKNDVPFERWILNSLEIKYFSKKKIAIFISRDERESYPSSWWDWTLGINNQLPSRRREILFHFMIFNGLVSSLFTMLESRIFFQCLVFCFWEESNIFQPVVITKYTLNLIILYLT